MNKSVIGHYRVIPSLKIVAVLLIVILSGCYEPEKDKEKLLPHITVWNRTDENLTVLLLPSGLPLKYSADRKYYSVGEYAPESVEACYYYYSKENVDGDHTFFSFSKTLEIYVFDTNTYHTYSHKELLQTQQYQLAHTQVKKKELDYYGGFFTIDRNEGVYTITIAEQ